MFCCPIMKSLVAILGITFLGYTGYESYALYNKHQELRSPGCCGTKQTPALGTPVRTTEEDCCPADEVADKEIAAATGECCQGASRAAALAGKCAEGPACCQKDSSKANAVAISTTLSAPAEGWANITGQVVFGGDALPKVEEFKVTSDQAHCLSKGALLDKVWDVNPSNKGVAGVVVFINPERDQKLEVHPSLQAIPPAFVLDQPYCVFTPRVFAIRAGQSIIAKNPDPIAHNVVIKGLKNDLNMQITPGTDKQLKLSAETNAMQVACGSHPWMKGYCWCFDHPYFAVTDKDGKFEIKNVPAGSRKIVVWHETGYLAGYGKRDNKTLNLASGSTTDMGTVKAMPK